MFLSLWGVALAWSMVPVQADVRSYCEAYARNQADVRLSGSAILGAKSEQSPEAWEERKTLALADCLMLYEPKAEEEETVAAEPEPEPKPKAKAKATTAKKAKRAPTLLARRTAPAQQEKSTAGALVPGSNAWANYCASKYASFDRATGNYKSYSGKQKPCRIPRG